LEEFYRLRDYIFKNNILWLKPTLEKWIWRKQVI
jgi:hypothetical protein